MAKEEELPGLTLRVHEKTLSPCAGSEFKATGLITLSVEVKELDVWDKVVEKLDGLAIYSVSTITETLVEAARRRANKAEQIAMRSTEESRAQIEQLESALSFRQADVDNLKNQLGAALAELEVLRDFERSVNAAAR